MKVSWCLLTILFLIGLLECEPQPLKTELYGYSIAFPTTLGELKQQHPGGRASKVNYSEFRDSTQSVQAVWAFKAYGGNPGNRDDKSQPHGVNIFLKYKGNQFDSVKMNLESRFERVLTLMPFPKLDIDPNSLVPRVYACDLSENAILILTKAASHRGEPWSQYNTVRIGIGYNMNAEEKEFFVIKSGDIHGDPQY